MTENLNIILGSGFSYEAGFPLAVNINELFNRDLREKLLRMSSDEWMWIDRATEADINNGRLNYDWLGYSYVLNLLIKEYISEIKSFDSYEGFYQFYLDKLPEREWFEKLFEKAKEELIEDKELQKDEELLKLFEIPQIDQILHIINHLIADTLRGNVEDTEVEKRYDSFIKTIRKYTNINVFTLNHDRFLENLLLHYNFTFNDGFSAKNSILKYRKEFIPIFQNTFSDSGINIFKLHGSVDLYQFPHCEQKGSILEPNGDYDYYKTTDYYTKHGAIRIDPITQEVIQDYNINVTPRFITGTNKEDLINTDKMYSVIFAQFEKRLNSKDDLIIIGYSYGDEHVNRVIEKSVKDNNPTVINVNPGRKFPFEVDKNIQLESIFELNKL